MVDLEPYGWDFTLSFIYKVTWSFVQLRLHGGKMTVVLTQGLAANTKPTEKKRERREKK